jgi:hypothetical protein
MKEDTGARLALDRERKMTNVMARRWKRRSAPED